VEEFAWKKHTEENREVETLDDSQIADLFSGGKYESGRWGTLGVLQGPKVSFARTVFNLPQSLSRQELMKPLDDVVNSVPGLLYRLLGKASGGSPSAPRAKNPSSPAPPTVYYLRFANRILELWTDDSPIEAFKEYTTIERYRNDRGEIRGGQGFVMLHPKPKTANEKPYRIRVEYGNSVVKTLREGHNGNCIRILDTNPGQEEAILFHEANAVGWLIGCISPRPKDDRREDRKVYKNADGNPSYVAMNELMRQLEAHSNKGSLFVLDW
jgi:hypothetical protein